jgi:hypothetical protein
MSPSLGLKILVCSYEITWGHSPQKQLHHPHRPENSSLAHCINSNIAAPILDMQGKHLKIDSQYIVKA